MALDIRKNILYRTSQGATYTLAIVNLNNYTTTVEKEHKITLPNAEIENLTLFLTPNKKDDITGKFQAKGKNMEEILTKFQNKAIDPSQFSQIVQIQAQYPLTKDLLKTLAPKKKATPAGLNSYSSETNIFM